MLEETSSSPAYTTIRRKERAVIDETWIRDFLQRAPFGVMATVHEGRPFTVARNFAYDKENHAIYMHGAKKGRTYSNIQANDRVCLNVSEMGRLLPAERAVNFGVEYASVVIFGRASLVTDATEARHGLQLLLDKHFAHLRPDRDYEPVAEADLKVTAVFRIDIDGWSGKQKKAPADFPGAFFSDD